MVLLKNKKNHQLHDIEKSNNYAQKSNAMFLVICQMYVLHQNQWIWLLQNTVFIN